MKTPLAPYLESLIGKSIHVVGLGSTECTAFLQVLPTKLRKHVCIHDFSENIEAVQSSFSMTHVALPKPERAALLEKLLDDYPTRKLRNQYLEGIDEADILFLPQSWDLYGPNAPLKPWVNAHPEKVITLMDLYLRHLPCRVVGVTGTNGKTTVSSMIAALAEAAGLNVIVSGNHRYHAQLLPQMDTIDPEAVAVLEISHKHLSRLQRAPDISVLTNVSGDHLDQFDSFESYAARKRRLIERQESGATAIISGNDAECLKAVAKHEGPVYCLGGHAKNSWVTGEVTATHIKTIVGEKTAFSAQREGLKAPGSHNAGNLWMAMASLHALGIPWEKAFSGAASFRGVKHRLEYLRSLNGVAIYDDTAATSPSATLAAINALLETHSKVSLIVGGDGKGNVYDDLQKKVEDPRVNVLGLGGDASALLGAQLCLSLKGAIEQSLEGMEKGDAILVSPAGAGFHQTHSEGSGPGLRQLVRRWGRG